MVWGGSSVNSISHLSHMGSIASKRSAIRPYQLGPGSSREPFPCLFLCGECGYLATEPTRPDPSLPPMFDGTPRRTETCPACKQRGWIDLGYTAYAEVLRAREAEDRRHPPERLKWRIRLASLSTGGAIGLGGVAGVVLSGLAALSAPLVVTLGAAAVGLTHAFGRHGLGRSIMTEKIDNPSRWHIPLPLPDPRARPASRLVGHVRPTGALLRAPLSGRMCVGYDLGVLFDAPGDAWPPIWVLREVHTGTYEVEGRTISADSTQIALPILPVAAPVLDHDQQARFLRERGLFLADGQFDFFEAIVEPGHTYELLWPSAPDGAPPVLHPAAHQKARNPYR